ncbi:MAG: hypothetical protein LUC85_07620 [Bacteroidales bacterium]|nr:hypothetical protein [Bacteroidales bacterium]
MIPISALSAKISSKTAWWIWVAVIFSIFGILSALSPFSYDSFHFDALYKAINHGAWGFNWDSWMSYCDNLATWDNARIAQLVAPLLTMFIPTWLWGLLSGIAFATLFGVSSLLIGHNKVVALAFTWILAIVCIPWTNNLLVGIYILNYFYTAAFAFLLVWLLFREPLFASRHRVLYYLCTFLLAILTGWGHEIFGASIGSGLIAWLLIGKDTTSRKRFIALVVVVLIMATVIPLSCGGMGLRLDMLLQTDRSTAKILLRHTLTILVWLTLIYQAVKRPKGFWDEITRDPVLIAMAVAGLATLTIHCYTGADYRAALCGVLASIIALGRLFLKSKSLQNPHGAILATCVLGVCTLQGIMANIYEYPYYKQFREVMDQLSAHPGSTVYIDVLPVNSVPPWVKLMTNRGTFVEPFPMSCLRSDSEQATAAVVPTCLKRDLDLYPCPEMILDSIPEGYNYYLGFMWNEKGCCYYIQFQDIKGKMRYYYVPTDNL